ncbi:RNA-directed DNA polymerase, eukaryota [Tanacetum coccineum]
MSIQINKKKEQELLAEEQAAFTPYWKIPIIDDDDDEYTIQDREYLQNSSNAFIPVLPIEEPDNSLSMEDEHLNTILETESDEVTKSSVEDLVPIPSESVGISNDTDDDSFEDIDYVEASPPDSKLVSLEEVKDDILHEKLLNINLHIARNLPSSDDFSPMLKFTPLFEFDDDNISSDVNPLFDEVLEDIECKDSYDSNLDESTFLVTPLSDYNEDECLAPSDDIELLIHHDPSISVVSILEGFTDEPPLEENDDLFDLESKENDWKKILYDALIDDLITEDKVFDPGIHEKKFSPTYVSLTFEERHYLSYTYVIRVFFPYFTYPVDYFLPLSSGSEDTIFDFLEREVSRDEIRSAVWNCGDNKSPGPDGYTFEFFKKYWGFIGIDFFEAVEHFFNNGAFAKGCNSSFIALIPKIMDAKLVTDFRPISLIGCVYKVVTKILANRLAMVISNIVSNIQSAFVSERQIFIINEVLHWCKRKNKKAMFFKVDFAKAYDSVRWDYLIDVLEAFGFGMTWCQWIRGLCCFAKASVLVNGSPSREFQF